MHVLQEAILKINLVLKMTKIRLKFLDGAILQLRLNYSIDTIEVIHRRHVTFSLFKSIFLFYDCLQISGSVVLNLFTFESFSC